METPLHENFTSSPSLMDTAKGPEKHRSTIDILEKTQMVTLSHEFVFPSETNVTVISWRNDDVLTTGSKDGYVRTWTLSTGHFIEEAQTENYIFAVSWDPKGQKLLYSDVKGLLAMKDQSSGKVKKFKGAEDVASLHWHPSEEKFLVASNKNVLIYEISHEEAVQRLSHDLKCECVQWSGSGKMFASCGDDLTVRIWDFETKKERYVLKEHTNVVYHLKWDSGNKRVCSAGIEKTMIIWSVDSGEILQKIFTGIFEIWCLDWSKNDQYLAIVGKDKALTVFQVDSQMEIYKSLVHDRESCFVRWSPKNSKIATCGYEGKVCVFVWNLSKDLENVRKFNIIKNGWSMDWNYEPSRLAIGVRDGLINVFEMDQNPPKQVFLDIKTTPVLDVSWYLNGNYLLACTSEEIFLWFYPLEEIVWRIKEEKVLKSRAKADLSYIACSGQKVRIWERESENKYKMVKILEAEGHGINEINWNKAGSRFLTCGNDGIIKLYNTENWEIIYDFSEHIGEVWKAIWSIDEYWIVSGGVDGIIRVFNAENGEESLRFDAHQTPINMISWMDNGTKLLTTSEQESSFKIWDFNTGILLLSFYHKDYYCLACADGQGNIAFSGGYDHTLLLFNYKEQWGNQDQFKIYYFLFKLLPKMSNIPDSFEGMVRNLAIMPFINENESIFHFMIELEMNKGLRMLIDFYQNKKIYPNKFYDNPENRLLNKLLTSNLPTALKITFIEFTINADVPLGNMFIITAEDLCSLMDLESIMVYKLLENSFKKLRRKYFGVRFRDNSIKSSVSVVDSVKNIREEDFVGSFQGEQFNDVSFISFKESREKPFIQACDLPIGSFSGQLLRKISQSERFEDFCKSQLINSFMDFLWYKYVKLDFFIQNLFIILYFILFIINSLFMLPAFLGDQDEYQTHFLVVSVLTGVVLMKLASIEIFQYRSNSEDYFNSVWNYIDVINIFVSFFSIIFNLLNIFKVIEEFELLRLLNSLCFFLSMIRVFDFFRAFKETCFLIEIVVQVITDMKVFLFLMFLLLANFSCSVYILQTDYSKGIVESFVAFYELMLGNTEIFEEYETVYSSSLIVVYMISTLILVIVMLNLLISIIGDTYGRVSEVNELIYEKNRVIMVADFLSDEKKKEKIENIHDKFLMCIYREDPSFMEMSEIQKSIYNLEKGISQEIKGMREEIKKLMMDKNK